MKTILSKIDIKKVPGAICSPYLAIGLLLGLLWMPLQEVRAQLIPSFGSDRAGTAGFQFLKVPVDARSAALSQAVVARAFDASSLFWNPALAARVTGFNLGVHHTEYFADIALDYGSMTYHFAGPRLTLGVNLQTMMSGQMDVTTEFQPFGTGQSFQAVSFAAGLTVAQQMTDLFSYGVTAKYVNEGIAEITTETMVFDLGIFYQIGSTGAQMAVAIRNFGLDGKPSGEINRTVIGNPATVTEDSFERITPPTMFMLGISYTLLRADAMNDLVVSVQLNNPNDNAENLSLGSEYTWNNLLVFRAGYKLGVEEFTVPDLGVGLILPFLGPRLHFDYAYGQLERLGVIHRVGLNLGIGS